MVDKKTGVESKTVRSTKKKAPSKNKEIVSREKVEPEIRTQTSDIRETTKTSVAKAGKRSAKGTVEAEKKLAKATKQAVKKNDKAEVKTIVRPPRQKKDRASQRYKKAFQIVDASKKYSLTEAIDAVISTSTTKFDSTIEIHINLAVDPKTADQNIRGSVVLPGGSGKSIKVAVFADDEQVKAAKLAGADITDSSSIISNLEKNKVDFEILIATPDMMPKLAKYARLLGPKGLMPNPKSGTVTTDVAKAVTETKAGKIEYRVDESGIVHLPVGKSSFDAGKIKANIEAVLETVAQARPASVKGEYIKSIYLTSTMGPSIKISE